MVPYCNLLNIISSVGQLYPKLLVQAPKEGKYVRFIGDNLNFSVGTSHETSDSHKHMVHMFTSTALIYDQHLLDLTNEPQMDFATLIIDQVLPSSKEYTNIRKDVTKLVLDIITSYLPFSHLQRNLCQTHCTVWKLMLQKQK